MQPRGDVLELRPPSTDLGSERDLVRPSELLSSVREEIEREARYAPMGTLDPAPPRRVAQDPPPADGAPGAVGELLAGGAMLLVITGGLFVVLLGLVSAGGALLAP